MRLPRGLQTGGVPTGRVAIGSEKTALAGIARQVSDFSETLLAEKAQAEFTDALSAVDAAGRQFVGQQRQIQVNSDTGKPSFETAREDFDSFWFNLEKQASKSLTTNRARDELRKSMRDMQRSFAVDVEATARSQLVEHNRVRNTAALERYVKMGEFDNARLVLENANSYFSPADRQKLDNFIDGAEELTAHDSQVSMIVNEAMSIRKINPDEAAAFLTRIKEGTSDEFTPEARAEAATMGLAQFRQADELDNRATAQEDTRRRVDRAIAISGFKREITAATPDEQITEFARRQAITDQGLVSSLFAQRDKKREAQTVLQSDYFDPTDRKVRGMVDTQLAEVYSDPTQRLDAAIAIAADTGIASTGLERYFESGSRSPESFAETASRYQLFRESAPNAYLPLSDDAKALFSQAATLTRAGMDPVLAANVAWDAVNNAVPEQVQDRRDNYPADEVVGEVIADLNDIPGMHKPGLFFDSTADVPAEMAGDMNRIGLAVYQRTGSVDAAREAVRSNIVNAWQFTDVNEGVRSGDSELEAQYMKGAPRRGSEFVRNQLTADIAEQPFFFGNEVQTVDPSRVELYQPPLPEQNEYGQPVWTLRVDGQLLLDERGQVVRWTYELPPGTEKPMRASPTVTPAGFISLPGQATGIIERPSKAGTDAVQ